METKKEVRKIDFLNISREEQERILKDALMSGQKEQRKLEKEYERILMRGAQGASY